MLVCRMTLILSRVVGGRWKKKKKRERHEMTIVLRPVVLSMARVAVCGSAKHTVTNTRWPTEQLSGKSAQSITNTQTFVHENLNQHFSAPEEKFFKRIKTHLLIYHSQRTQLSSWQVSLTCFTHLKQPVCKLRLWTSQDVLRVCTHLTS